MAKILHKFPQIHFVFYTEYTAVARRMYVGRRFSVQSDRVSVLSSFNEIDILFETKSPLAIKVAA